MGGIDLSDGLGGHSSPGGSSSGSGISVAAGFAPMAIGTETEGSLISPSTRQSLYTIKPTLGTVPNAGIMPVSFYLDVAGPMCRSVKDTVDLLSILAGKDHPNIPAGGFNSAMKGAAGWKSLKVGTLDPAKFRYDSSLQTPIPEAIEQIVSPPLKHRPQSWLIRHIAASSYFGRIQTYQNAGAVLSWVYRTPTVSRL
jgi:amidase